MIKRIFKFIKDFLSISNCYPEKITNKGNYLIIKYSCLKLITFLIISVYISTTLVDIILKEVPIRLFLCRFIASLIILLIHFLPKSDKVIAVSRLIIFLTALISFAYEITFNWELAVILIPLYLSLFSLFILTSGRRMILILFPLITLYLLAHVIQKDLALHIQNSEPVKIISYHKGFYSLITVTGIIIILHITRIMYWNIIKQPRNHSNGHNFIVGQTEDDVNLIVDRLTFREKEIYFLKLRGKTNKEIANLLNIDLSTVKTHINNIHKKSEDVVGKK